MKQAKITANYAILSIILYCVFTNETNKQIEQYDKVLVKNMVNDILSQFKSIEENIAYLPSFLQDCVKRQEIYKKFVNPTIVPNSELVAKLHEKHKEAINICKTYLTYQLLE
jgi:hypothetical protein